jgi:hypothetical protein
VLREDRIAIVDQILLLRVPNHLPELLQRPRSARARSDVHVGQASGAVLYDDEHVQHPERGRDGDEEVAGEDGGRMVLQEG